MAYYSSPPMASKPYQESPDRQPLPQTPVHDMNRNETVERKLSKRRSNSGTSLWSKKSKRSTNTQPSPTKDISTESLTSVDHSRKDYQDTHSMSEGTLQTVPPRSVIPDMINGTPSWYNSDIWSAVPMPSHRVRYPIHNPHGPRWYKNHHLIPPSQVKPSVRPPSFFSPSFPPISATSGPEPADDLGPSRTPSHSPLPTPNSSQTGVADPNFKPRSRKTSQTTPDNVDLMDVTDPWGTNWHHQSPYDLAIRPNASTDSTEQGPHGRVRRASMTAAQGNHRAAVPSPLSQSTSAVHLQAGDAQSARIPRKLSKRKTPAVNDIFGSDINVNGKAVSAPVSPVDIGRLDHDLTPLPKRMSVAPPLDNHSVVQSSGASSKKEKRGSVLGRLVKKFSILRKGGESGKVDTEDNRYHSTAQSPTLAFNDANSFALRAGSHSPEKSVVDLTKRVPPPSMGEMEHPPPSEGPVRRPNRVSIDSVNPHVSIGRLTIANPDTPEHERSSTPEQPPAPPEKTPEVLHRNPKDSDTNNQLPTPHVSDPMVAKHESTLPPSVMNSPPPISLYLAPLVSISQTPPANEHRPLPPEKPKARTTTALILNGDDHKHGSAPHASSEGAGASRPSIGAPPLPDDRADASATLHSNTSCIPSEKRSQRVHSRHIFPSIPMQSEVNNLPPSESLLQVPAERLSSLAVYNDSPLSTSSVLANPPTPYDMRLSIPGTPESVPPPPLPSKVERKRSSHESSGADKTVGRQTETFKLVRSASGNVYASSETIVAAGQQWEVVESLEGKAKRRATSSKSKEKEASGRKESRGRTEETDKARKETEVDEYHRRSRTHRSSRQPEESSSPTKSKSTHRSEKRELSKREERATSHSGEQDTQTNHRSGTHKRDDSEVDHRQARKRDDREEDYSSRRHNRKESDKEKRRDERDRENTSDRRKKSVEHPEGRKREDVDVRKNVRKKDGKGDRGKDVRTESSSAPHVHAPSTHVQLQAASSVPQPQSSKLPLERRPSTSTRPTSELPSAADMNALRAKEAWEMERLWKARSMHGIETNGNPNSIIPPSGSVVSDNATPVGAAYGSSHTAFVVQGPFQGHQPYFYHSTSGPSPYMYPSPSSVPSIHGSASSYDPIVDKGDPWPSSSPNPLPDPPRESTYKPAVLSPIQRSNRRSTDHWTTTYNGMTTTH